MSNSPNPAGIFLNPERVNGSAPLNVDAIPSPIDPNQTISILEIFWYYPHPPQIIQTGVGQVETPWAEQAGADYDFLTTDLYGTILEYGNYPEYLALPMQRMANLFGSPGGFTFRGVTYVNNGKYIPG